MDTLIGLVMIYVWIHGAVIVGKKVKGATSYEKGVLIAAVSTLVLFIVGALS